MKRPAPPPAREPRPPSPWYLAPEEQAAAGRELHELATALQPLPRSLTGDGVRATLAAIDDWLGSEASGPARVTRHEVPSGTSVLDWTVPPEWNLKSARLTGPHGEIIADTARNLLHVVGYSAPFSGSVPLSSLEEHLHSLPEQPGAIPYRTSYYRETWGFCLPHHVRDSLPEGLYEVEIDATLGPGHLTYGEVVIPATQEGSESPGEILVSTHVCHPVMANDNLSGLVVAAALARRLAAMPSHRHTYRLLFLPGTIGAISWLAAQDVPGGAVSRLRHGLVLSNLGDSGGFHYKRSRRTTATIDRAAPLALRDLGEPFAVEDFTPFGYDERQFNSPGFDLPVGALSRTPWGRYPQYHTSLDDLRLVRPEALGASLAALLGVLEVVEGNATYRNLSPKGEPQLGRRGLYGSIGGVTARDRELAFLWVLNQSDGTHDLISISERSGIAFATLRRAADELLAAQLLAPAN